MSYACPRGYYKYFGDLYRVVSEDIFAFCRALKFEPTWQQKQLLEAVQRGLPRIAVRSGQGPGKTTASAVVGLWRLIRNPYSKLIVTAPTMGQCKDAWLAEARRRLRVADPALQRMFNVTSTRIGVCGQRPEDWGVLLKTSTKSENAQGQHGEDMDIICEEASGVPREIIEQYRGTLTNPKALFLMIGNPNTRDCAFFDCFNTQRHNWHCLHWNAEETPESRWFSYQRNREFEEEFGRDSDAYRVRVLGEFPHADPDCIMSNEEVERVMNRQYLFKTINIPREDIYGGGYAKQIGMDLARYGRDESTIFRRSGNAIVEWKVFHRWDPSRVIWKAFDMQDKADWSNPETIYVADAGGIGQGCMHLFHDSNKRLMEFHTESTPYHDRYKNMMTEAWFHLAKLVRKQHCYIPYDNQLIQQLCSRKYKIEQKTGKIIIESKDDYKKRDLPSPDRADGLVMAFYDAVRITVDVASRKRGGYVIGSGVRQ